MFVFGTGTTYPGPFYFEGEGGSGGSSTEGTKNSGGTEAENSGGTETEDNSGKEPKFTQEQLDAIVAREKSKASRGKLDPKELGFDSQKELKEFLDKVKEKEKAEQTDSEKELQEAKEKAEKEAEAKYMSKANTRLVKAEFMLKAKEFDDYQVRGNAVEDAYVLAQTLDDWDVEVTDEGVVTGLTEDFFKALKESKPFLFESDDEEDPQKRRRQDIGAGAGGGGNSGGDEAALREAFPALKHIT